MAAASCGAKTKAGTPCTLHAGWGTDHVGYGACKLHGGCVPSGKKYAARLMAADLVGEEDITALDALEREVRRVAASCTYWAMKVSELRDDEMIVTFQRTKTTTIGDGGEETVTSTSAELNIAVRAFNEAQERAVRIYKVAIELGIDERRVRALEQWVEPGVQLLEALKRALWDRLDTDGRRVFRETAQGQLLALEGGKG